MKLRLLSALYTCAVRLEKLTTALNRGAGWLHVKAWAACDRENIRTLNVRRVRGLRIP